MKVILHIGTGKTGSSSIQEFLLQNKAALIKQNICYLHMDGRNEYRDFSAYCMKKSRVDDYLRRGRITSAKARENFDGRFLSSFRRNVESVPKNVHTVIISSEHFSSRLKSVDELYRAKELLDQYFTSVQIICYLRDQAAKICSKYSTFIKSGRHKSFNEFFHWQLEDKKMLGKSDYDKYDDKLALWEEVFGFENIKVRLFDSTHFLEGSLLNDFCNVLDESLFDCLNTPIQLQNTALTRRGCELLRRINYVFPERIRGIPSVENGRIFLIRMIAQYVGGPPVLLTNEQFQLVKEHFGPSNERTRAKYFPALQCLFWSDI